MTFCVKKDLGDKLFIYKPSQKLIVFQKRNLSLNGNFLTNVRIFRILFSIEFLDKKLIKDIINNFNPDLVVYNLIFQRQMGRINDDCLPFWIREIIPLRNELIINIPFVADHKGRLNRDYRKALKRQPNLKLIEAEKGDEKRIFIFLKKWSKQVEKVLGPGQTAENDKRFVSTFLGDKRVKFWLAVEGNDRDNVIGYTAYTYHPLSGSKLFPHGLAVKIICKNLRKKDNDKPYTKLGQWLMCTEAQKLKEEGYEEALMGGNENPTQAKFKEQFMNQGKKLTYFSKTVFISQRLLCFLDLNQELARSFLYNLIRNIWD
jgi:hypothetical protein